MQILEGLGVIYKEDPLHKRNQGGLLSKGVSKIVHVYPSNNKMCCPVYLFKKYVGLMPNTRSCKKLYLRMKKNATPCM